MHEIFYYIIIYLVIGAAGMFIANKKVDAVVRRQRWLKYATYVLITSLVISSILTNVFKWLFLAIAASGLVELILVNVNNRKQDLVISFLAYLLIASGFIFFAFNFKSEAVLFIYFQVLIFDAFGQITGQLFGKNLLAPEISPSKTIEGLIGGWVFCIISAMIGANWVGLTAAQGMMFGLLTGFTSFCGDILASWFKRIQGIKDYSNWLPGQGGFLDRFDSFMFSGACYYLIGISFNTPFI